MPYLSLPWWLICKESTWMQEMQETQVWSLGQEDPLEVEMATHSSILAWKIPWTEDPDRLQFMGLHRNGHDWATEQVQMCAVSEGFSWWLSGKEPACQYRRRRRCEFNLWVRKIPWRWKWQPTPVFLPGESHGQKSLVAYSPQGCTELDTTEVT